MTNITPLIQPTDERATAFNEFWKWYPHNPSRKSKAAARSLFMKITSPGGVSTRTKNKDSGGYIDIHLEATPDEIIAGCKIFRQGLTDRQTYKVDSTYAPDAVVWLNGGRWDNE